MGDAFEHRPRDRLATLKVNVLCFQFELHFHVLLQLSEQLTYVYSQVGVSHATYGRLRPSQRDF